ncbi:MAG: hypothetical protein ACQESE_01820 [Nanobdellota archaeon]
MKGQIVLVFTVLLILASVMVSAQDRDYMDDVKKGDMSPMEAIMKMKAEENTSEKDVEEKVNRTNTNMLVLAKVFFKEYIEMGNPIPELHLGKFYKDMLYVQGDSETLGFCVNSTIEHSRTEEFRNCLYNKTLPENARTYNNTISSIKHGVDVMSKHNMNFIGIPFVQEIIS